MPFKMNLRPMMRNMAPMARNNMPQGGLNMAAPPTGYRMPQNPMMASPGGGGGFDERTGTYIKAPNPIFNALRNVNIPMTGGAPNTRPGIFGGLQPRAVTPEEAMAITSMPAARPVAADQGFNPVTWMNQPYTPVSPQPSYPTTNVMTAPTVSEYITSNVMPPPTRDIQVPSNPGPSIIELINQNDRNRPTIATPQPMPAFDPNRALNDYNNRLAGIYAGGGNMDMNMVRAQQANLRNLQVNRDATPEQHDAAYRNAMAELRARYPDAFAG